MTLDDWVLALHVLSAFAFVGGTILFWMVVVAVRRTDTPAGTLRMEPIVKVGNAIAGIGAGGALVFGVWLAFSVGDHDIWDPWIVAALALWIATGAVAGRTGKAYAVGMIRARELQAAGDAGPNAELLALNRTQSGLVLHTVTSVLLLLILVDMIWKPGA